MEVRRKDDSLAHHGIQGQKWGVRRYQNEDGSLTDAGKKRYSRGYAGKIEKRLDSAKTQDEKTYIIRSETRKNTNRSIDAEKYAAAVSAATGTATALGTKIATGSTVAAFCAGTAAMVISSAASGAVAGGIRFVNRYRNTALANLADKYGIEDSKVRHVD